MSSIRGAFTNWLIGGGEMGERIRSFDWAKTPLGPIESWSPALRMMTRFLLANRFSLLLWWGPHYTSIYNDAYRPVLGDKHPRALGQPASECWKEIWPVLQPLIDTPFHGGPATWNDDILLKINRHGFVEETHFTIAYSPVPDEAVPSGIGGVLATVHEITEKVVGERRVTALRDLGGTADAKTAEEACRLAAKALVPHDKDIPFALLYLIDSAGRRARLAASVGMSLDEPAAQAPFLDLDADGEQPWPLGSVGRTNEMQVIGDLASRLGELVPLRPWSDPPREAVVVPIRSNISHQLAGVLVAGVSARLKLDESYRSFYELVASRIGAAVANARAYEEEKKRAEALAEVDRAKTLFFSNISHEFRTPLTLMLGPLEDALASPGLQGKERENLTTAHRNSLRLLKLVNTLMDFSRVEAGRFQAAFHPCDLSALTADLASTFRSACERAGLRLIVRCAPLPKPVYLDREMWEKIVLNLLSNSFKFTFAGEIEVSCRADGSHAEVSIRDTGTGIPEHELPRIFERFHRVENAEGRTHEGTGIGLALVKELVKLQGGAIEVSSRYGEGTVFTIRLPFGAAHLPKDQINAAGTQASTATHAEAYIEEALRWLPEHTPSGDSREATAVPTHGGHRPRVLIADDNADMRAYLRSILSSRYDVEMEADGAAAIQAMRTNRPALAILDVMMPRMDGFAVLRELREHPSLKDLPVILLSARAGEEAEAEGLAAGADDYIVKPFSARELLARVQASLTLATLRNEATAALRSSEERLRRVLETDAVGVLFWNREGTLVDANNVFLRMTGYTREEVKSGKLHWRSLTAPEYVRASEAQLENFAITGRVGPYEKEYLRKDGSRNWMLFAGRDLGDGSIVEFAIDIADRKRAEAALRESEQRLQLLLREVNHRAKNMLSLVQAVARQTAAASPKDFLARFAERIQAVAKSQDLLVKAEWKGVELAELVRLQLAHFHDLIGGLN